MGYRLYKVMGWAIDEENKLIASVPSEIVYYTNKINLFKDEKSVNLLKPFYASYWS